MAKFKNTFGKLLWTWTFKHYSVLEILIWNSEWSEDSGSDRDSYTGQIFDVAVLCNIWTFNFDDRLIKRLVYK